MKLCKHQVTLKYFALKVMSIEEILKMKQAEHVKNEKRILQVFLLRENKTKQKTFRVSGTLS